MKKVNAVSGIMEWAEGLVDAWFPVYLRPAVKTALKANQHRVSSVVDVFTDANGNVLINDLIDEYINLIPEEGYQLSAVEIFGDNMITRNISIKVLERSDLHSLKNLLLTKYK